uniref:Structural maintenance of chromosomes flexible hinge domain containing 1 n=1 Tax=Mastacembelus armatus TaxID=205130 RepID=A0A7N8XT20_9TELE
MSLDGLIALDYDRFEELQHNSTLYLMRCENQDLPTAMKEHITFTPHYDTLIRSGMYEYYASEGQVSLPYALAELVDNALSATAKNTGMRSIEIRMLFDETLGKPAVVVLDNGCGMTSKQLKNWAVYRLSKFTRKNSSFASQQEGYVRPDPVAHSLNSDISYFGVGGKQAVFYIGDSTRMISKAVLSPDVHELVLSKDDFERKEKNKEDIYSGTILNRKPGDFSHCPDERFLHALIAEESEKESFTAVVITGVNPEHITFLKKDFKLWTRQLAHIYHYYIHGIDGNNMSKASANSNPSKIDIQVTLREKAPKFPRALNLREVDDDMQTLYINASADTFEFKATTQPENGTVEGVLRYHPFLYDKETYPQDPQASLDDKEDDDVESGVHNQARGSRPIFECFWNGRLIPYTKVAEFDWCARPRTQKEQDLPPECYSRISGVLFTDDRFQVSTNKLTFMDLELALRRNDTIFTCEQKIEKEFTQWLKNCHKNLDKQIQFLDYKETITLPDVTPKERQAPWATFGSIKWHGKTYKTGELVKSQRTNPTLYGKVVRFLLYGNYKGDVFATGGQVEVALEPKAFYNKTRRIIPIIKIDRTSTDDAINKHIKSDADKLPHELKVEWPNGNPFSENADYPAGTPLGPLKIEILNKKGESLSRMPRAGQSPIVVNSICLSGTGTNQEEMLSYVAEHSAKWNFWFKKIENLTKVGKYTLFLNAMTNDSNQKISPVHIGMPFNIPLQIKDKYGHSTELPPNIQPEKCDLKVILPGLTKGTQTQKIFLLPGKPHSLHVKPEDNPITGENGNPFKFDVEIHDEAGNITANARQLVHCEVHGYPEIRADCSQTGVGQFVTKPINLKIIKGEPQKLTVKFSMPVSKTVKRFLQDESASLVLRNSEKIEWLAGGLLENLHYKLFDEAGREIRLTPEIASMIKVTWAEDGNLKDLVQGKLPNIQVPTKVQDARFCKVLYEGQSVSVSFTIVPCPDEPTQLQVTLPQTQTTVKLGETLSKDISEYESDHHKIYKGYQYFCYHCVNVPQVHVNVLTVCLNQEHNSCVAVTGVCFQNGTPGSREMRFTFRKYVACVTVMVTAGDPAQLKLPLQVLNGSSIPTPFIVQLFDMWGNPTQDQRVVVECSHLILKVLFYCCSTRGYYQLEFKGSFNDKPISGTSLNLNLLPNPNKPVRLSVEYDTKAKLPIIINVVPNQPVKLGPDSQPPAPVVSYSTAITNRTLVENMTLRIMDSYGNPTGQNLHGKVAVSMKSSSCDGSTNLPLFEGKNSRCQFNLVEGKVHITRLAIMENSPGENGNEYNLIFKPEVSLEAPTPLIPFELKFLFYNDSENQHKMSALSGKKDALNVAIAKYEEIFNDHQTLLMLLTAMKLHFKSLSFNLSSTVETLILTLLQVGHLACVQDDDAARVISWHLSGDMDCVITTTTAAARTIVDNTLGRQQVMPLDGILMHPGNRPLPHLRNGTPLFPPQGNPIYARDLLIYSHRPEDCNTVFKNILGDTILMDDLYSGTEYRKAVSDIQCPTILTRQGDRISARGKFGGTQNKAPTISALKVFGAPLPGRYHTLREQIGDLSRSQVSKLNSAVLFNKDRESHLIMMKSPDNQNKQQDLKEKKKQLEEIERQLGMFVDFALQTEKLPTSFHSFLAFFGF